MNIVKNSPLESAALLPLNLVRDSSSFICCFQWLKFSTLERLCFISWLGEFTSGLLYTPSETDPLVAILLSCFPRLQTSSRTSQCMFVWKAPCSSGFPSYLTTWTLVSLVSGREQLQDSLVPWGSLYHALQLYKNKDGSQSN